MDADSGRLASFNTWGLEADRQEGQVVGLGAAEMSWQEVKGEKDLGGRAQESTISQSPGSQERAHPLAEHFGNVCQNPCVWVNFRCHWAGPRRSESCSNVILDVSVQVVFFVLDEINI